MKTIINFETSKLLKEKGFDGQCIKFYTKPNSKMFGIDEHHRTYPIKNISKKLYTAGCEVALNVESIYLAPTIAETVMWLLEKHGIWISVSHQRHSEGKHWRYIVKQANGVETALWEFNSATEAYVEAINYTLKNLI